MTKLLSTLLVLAVAAGSACAKTWVLTGGTIHPVSSEPIEGGTIVFDKTGILAIGTDVAAPEGAKTVDCSGKHIYPSLIAPHSQLGLIELPSVRATVDTTEAGPLNPNATAHKAFNPDSEVIPVTRSNGVLLALVAPSGGLLSGQSSLMRLSGWTWEDMLLEPSVALNVSWPSARRADSLAELKKLFDDVRTYRVAREASPDTTPIDLRWEAMLPVLDGERPLMVEADGLAEIEAAVAFATWQKVKLIILGGYDAPLCAPLLKEYNVPVVVSSIHRLPLRRTDPYDAPYSLPERLRAAGVTYCIGGDGRFASNVRNLPYHAATAVAYGLPADEALKSITLYPAQILGVADRVGSLEKGKEATLFVTDGDPLETPTQVLDAYVAGEKVDLMDRHKRFYEHFKQRLE
jgi:imidazolonepropionase-like amidohydrolase